MVAPAPLALPEHRSLFASFGLGLADAVAPPDRVDVAEGDFETWLEDRLGDFIRGPYASFHREFWLHVFALRAGVAARAFIAIWFRGGGKSSTIEASVVVVACERTRRYGLYVCNTQDQADQHVQNVAELLESPQIERLYPDVAKRWVGKFGNQKGWRRNRLVTGSGFTLDAIGLDTAARGRKMGRERPDYLIFDDLDEPHDTEATVLRKIATLTKTILPMRATHATVVGVQNLIHLNGIFARLVDGRADFLRDRTVSGPHPAITGFAYDQGPDGKWVITAGEPTWEQQDLATLTAELNDIGPTAFLAEKQHQPPKHEHGLFAKLIYARVPREQVPALERAVLWCDPAVSDTEASDCNAIQVDGLAADGTIYRLWTWEQRAGPEATLSLAIRKAIEFGCQAVGVETDQGGDTWRALYVRIAKDLARELGRPLARMPGFLSAKAGASGQSKAERATRMLADYERGRFVHVLGTHDVLEASLGRFLLEKPYDAVDAAYWSWVDLDTRGVPKAASRDRMKQAAAGTKAKGWQKQ